MVAFLSLLDCLWSLYCPVDCSRSGLISLHLSFPKKHKSQFLVKKHTMPCFVICVHFYNLRLPYCMLVTQSCLTVCDPMDCSPQGFSVHGILQGRTLEWVTIPFSRGSSQPRGWTQASCMAGGFFTVWAASWAIWASSWAASEALAVYSPLTSVKCWTVFVSPDSIVTAAANETYLSST